MIPIWDDDKVGEAHLSERDMREAFEMFRELVLSGKTDLELGGTDYSDQPLFPFRFGPKSPPRA